VTRSPAMPRWPRRAAEAMLSPNPGGNPSAADN
jgi:hypothetical protein